MHCVCVHVVPRRGAALPEPAEAERNTKLAQVENRPASHISRLTGVCLAGGKDEEENTSVVSAGWTYEGEPGGQREKVQVIKRNILNPE